MDGTQASNQKPEEQNSVEQSVKETPIELPKLEEPTSGKPTPPVLPQVETSSQSEMSAESPKITSVLVLLLAATIVIIFFIIHITVNWVPNVYKRDNKQTQSNTSGNTNQRPPYGTYYYLEKLDPEVHQDSDKKDYEQQRTIYRIDSSGEIKRIFDKVFITSNFIVMSPDGTKVIESNISNAPPKIQNLKTGKTWNLKIEPFQSQEGYEGQNIEELKHQNQDQWSPDSRYFLAFSKFQINIKAGTVNNAVDLTGQRLLRLDTQDFKIEPLVETKMEVQKTGGDAGAGTYNYSAIDDSLLSSPSYSPDGTKIAYKSRIRVGAKHFESDQIEILDANSKQKLKSIQTPNSKSAPNYFKNDISHYFWSQDSKSIVYINSEKNYSQPDETGRWEVLKTNDFIGQVNIETDFEKIYTKESLGLGDLHLDILGNTDYGTSAFLPWRARLIGSDLIFVYLPAYIQGGINQYDVYQVSLTEPVSKILKKVSSPGGYQSLLEYPILSRDGKWIIWRSIIENIQSGEKRKLLDNEEFKDFLDWFMQ